MPLHQAFRVRLLACSQFRIRSGKELKNRNSAMDKPFQFKSGTSPPVLSRNERMAS